jgi:putative flippase GtrA
MVRVKHGWYLYKAMTQMYLVSSSQGLIESMAVSQMIKSGGYTQFFRFVMVGVIQNLVGYALYILITWAGLDPKLTITVLYPVGFMLSYMGNRNWSFSHKGTHKQAIIRFAITHMIGYTFNIAGLYLLVDMLDYRHQHVQLLIMFILMFYFFFALRLFVFANGHTIGSN